MTPEGLTITLDVLAGTGSPPQWHCRISRDGAILLAISGSADAVLAALRAAIDELDRSRAAPPVGHAAGRGRHGHDGP